jgi:DNA adenine methylase
MAVLLTVIMSFKQKQIEKASFKPLKPLIKWAGGKTRLNPQLIKISDLALKSLNIEKFNYYEPFFGGGALFFELHNNEKIDNAHINDIIPHLISFYETVKDDKLIHDLFNRIEELANEFNEGDQREVYGSAKDNTGWVGKFNKLWMITDTESVGNKEEQKKTIKSRLETKENKIESAALFYVLNKTGFNGMFRLSQKGKFNIPKGDTNKISFDAKVKDNFRDISLLLSQTTIHLGSYKKLLPPENEIDKKTSFIYLDPPYIPDSKTADFTDYSKEGFDEKDHKQVADIFHQLAQDGYMVVLSNNSNDDAKEMYAKNNKAFAYEVDVSRAIAKIKEGKRPPSKELLVSSFNLSDLGMKRI